MAGSRDEFSSEEKQLFSLYAQYPDITFEPDTYDMGEMVPDREPPEKAEFESDLVAAEGLQPSTPPSPTTTILDGDVCDNTEMSGTTVQTTPLKDLDTTTIRGQTFRRTGTVEDEGTLAYFLQLVELNSVWPEMLESFTWLGTTISDIGQDLFPINSHRPLPQVDEIYARCKLLLRELIQENLDIVQQRERVAYLKALQAFNLDPPEEFIWTIFKQRLELIANHTSLPRKRELDLIHGLVVLFHIQLYGPFMDFLEKEEAMEDRFMRIFGSMWEKITRWLSSYNQWWTDMVDLKRNFIVPLWDQVQVSETVREELREQYEIQQSMYTDIVEDIDCS